MKSIIVIDAAYLNFITTDFKANFEAMLGRELSEIDLADLVTLMAMDAGITGTDNDVFVILTYNDRTTKLDICHPSDIPNELNDVAFKCELGEFSFHTFSTEQLVSADELFLDSVATLCENNDFKRIAVFGDNERLGDEIHKILKEVNDKIIVNFSMSPAKDGAKYQTVLAAYPIMHTLGIKPEELPQ